MTANDPYQAYIEGDLFSGNPVRLVIAIYESAIECVQRAQLQLSAGDIPGRAQAINKAIRLLTQLLISLDFERGGEISTNLQRLYGYMQSRLIEAHAKQALEPILEVEKLLRNLLDGWYVVAEKSGHEAPGVAQRDDAFGDSAFQPEPAYGFSNDETPAFTAGVCEVF